MARELTSGFATALEQPQLRLGLLVELQFKSATAYLFGGTGQLTYAGNVYLGLGEFGKISPITESTDIEATGLSLELTGIPPTLTLPSGETVISLLGEALGDVQVGNSVIVTLVLFDGSGNAIGDPYRAFAGRMDQPEVQAGTDTISIHLAVESRMVDLQRGQNNRYTLACQQLYYPTDTGFQYVAGLQDWNGSWGSN